MADLKYRDRLLQHTAKVESRDVVRLPPPLHLLQIQKIINKVTEADGLFLDDAEKLASLLFTEGALQHEFGKSTQRGKRRPQFVADGCDKLIFHALDFFALGDVVSYQRNEFGPTVGVAMQNRHGDDRHLGVIAAKQRALSIPRVRVLTLRSGRSLRLPIAAEIGETQSLDLIFGRETDDFTAAAVQKKKLAFESGCGHKILGRLQDRNQPGLCLL